jgi:hypothetical protein
MVAAYQSARVVSARGVPSIFMTTLISAENSRYTWMRLGLGWNAQKMKP